MSNILTGWREQYGRMRRSYDRLIAEAQGELSASSDHARDSLFHFFQDAYHLKDWLKNDPTVTIPAQTIEDAITDSDVLSLCADLCNGTKHFRLTTTKTSDLGTGFDTQSVAVRPAAVGSGKLADPPLHSWTVASGGTTRDAKTLAGDVVAAWDSWLSAHALA
jgi:hypothetical protein